MKTKAEVEEQIRSLGWWYQHFEFPNGARTGEGKEPGYDAETRWRLIEQHVPKDLTGKTVLDMGGNAGFFSIQMKLRGAAKCILRDDSILEDPSYPKMCFIEDRYNGDPTNWWLPNYTCLAAMVRSAGLRIIDRPHPHIIVARPEIYLGKVLYPKLVFPRYGKRREPVYPGSQKYDPAL
jgi:hypothetical protein